MEQPRQISDRLSITNPTGYVMPWLNGQISWMTLPGNTDWFFPIFSTVDLLRASGLPFDGIMQIDDPIEFFDSIPEIYEGNRIHVVLDPHPTEEGNTRYKLILRKLQPEG